MTQHPLYPHLYLIIRKQPTVHSKTSNKDSITGYTNQDFSALADSEFESGGDYGPITLELLLQTLH